MYPQYLWDCWLFCCLLGHIKLRTQCWKHILIVHVFVCACCLIPLGLFGFQFFFQQQHIFHCFCHIIVIQRTFSTTPESRKHDFAAMIAFHHDIALSLPLTSPLHSTHHHCHHHLWKLYCCQPPFQLNLFLYQHHLAGCTPIHGGTCSK